MTAYNVVRIKVKPGKDAEMLDFWKSTARPAGSRKLELIKTGDGTYCVVGEWDSMAAIAAARAEMIGNLDKGRHLLEDLGGGLGVTDPVSGEVVLSIA